MYVFRFLTFLYNVGAQTQNTREWFRDDLLNYYDHKNIKSTGALNGSTHTIPPPKISQNDDEP